MIEVLRKNLISENTHLNSNPTTSENSKKHKNTKNTFHGQNDDIIIYPVASGKFHCMLLK